MSTYFLPFGSLLLHFIACISCVRFLFTRQGKHWILPLILTLLFGLISGSQLLAAIDRSGTINFTVSFNSQLLVFVMAIIWYLMIIVFYFALKKQDPKALAAEDREKSRNEQKFLQKAHYNDGEQVVHNYDE